MCIYKSIHINNDVARYTDINNYHTPITEDKHDIQEVIDKLQLQQLVSPSSLPLPPLSSLLPIYIS